MEGSEKKQKQPKIKNSMETKISGRNIGIAVLGFVILIIVITYGIVQQSL
jgi:hypothetical protein